MFTQVAMHIYTYRNFRALIIKDSYIVKLQSWKKFSGNIVCHDSTRNMHIYKQLTDKYITVQFLTTGRSLSEKTEIQVEVKIFWTIWIIATEACEISKCLSLHWI